MANRQQCMEIGIQGDHNALLQARVRQNSRIVCAGHAYVTNVNRIVA